MTTLSADEKLLEIYKGELAPPDTWELIDAKAYRQQLDGVKTGEIARFAPIGRVPMSNTSIPKSFPFIQFKSETPSDEELLRRGNLIRNAMKKYDPYSSDNFEPKIKSFTGLMVSPDRVRYAENLVDAPSVKDPVIEYIKTLPPSPGPKMQILTSAKAFQNSDYDADKLYFWTDGKIDQPNMLKIHHAIKRHGGDFLLKLKEDHMEEVNRKKDEIDQQLKEFMTFGATGNYVNRYSFMEVLGQLNDDEAKRMMYDFDIDDSTYSLFSKVLDIDSKGYRKWKRYATAQFARYLRFMTMYSKEDVTTAGVTTDEDKDMKKYEDLNIEAAANRARIDAIRRVRAARAAPAAPAAPATAPTAPAAQPAGSNAATIQAQNDAVDQYINDVKSMTSLADLNQYLSTTGVTDTSLLPNKIDRQNEMGQAVRDKEAEFRKPNYDKMTLEEVSKLDEQTIRLNFKMEDLRKLLGYDMEGSKLDKNKFTNKELIEYDDLIEKVKSKEKFDPVKASKDKQRYEDKKEYFVGKCVQFDGNEVGTIKSVDLDKREVGVEKYKGDGTVITKSMDDIKTLTTEACDKLKGGVELALALQVKAQEEAEKKRKAEQKRLEEEEQKRKAEEEAEKERLKKEKAEEEKKALGEATALTIGKPKPKSNWYPLKQGKDILFYVSSTERPDRLMKIIDVIPDNPYILKHEKLDVRNISKKWLFTIDNKSYKIDANKNNKSFVDGIILTRNVGKALKIKQVQNGPEVSVILEQAKNALKALQDAGIVHQDIKLENMTWDGKKLTIIDFGNAREANKACNSIFNGDEYNILPPVGVSLDPHFTDRWSLVLALLQYGKKTMYAPGETVKGDQSLTRLLFFATAPEDKNDNGCFELYDAADQPGLMFHNELKNNRPMNRKFRKNKIIEILKGMKDEDAESMFYHLWFIFNLEQYTKKNKETFGKIVPGQEKDYMEVYDGLDYIKQLTRRMGDSNVDLAKKWVEGHLRWPALQSEIAGKEYKLINKTKILSAQGEAFKKVKIPDDLGLEYYGIPTKQVVEIFELIRDKEAATNATSQSVASLDYDSFSDAELDELEVTYEPYDEEELNRLMSEYDSSSGAEALSYNSYNSESEQSIESDSYDSDSD